MIKYELPKDKHRVYISKRFDDIYELLGFDTNKKVFDNRISLFLFAASIGYKYNKSIPLLDKVEYPIHCEQLTDNQLSTLYSIIINDDKLGKNIENFMKDDFLPQALKLIETYAEGGMQTICEKVFEDKWIKNTLIREYNEYDIDLLRFIYEERMSNPF